MRGMWTVAWLHASNLSCGGGGRMSLPSAIYGRRPQPSPSLAFIQRSESETGLPNLLVREAGLVNIMQCKKGFLESRGFGLRLWNLDFGVLICRQRARS